MHPPTIPPKRDEANPQRAILGAIIRRAHQSRDEAEFHAQGAEQREEPTRAK